MEEVIIQGKPYSGSKIATKGLNTTLVDRIFKIFFDSMGGIRINKALIVDTMYWDNMWYAVYTYSRYTNITDKSDDNKAGRQSYFSLSLVIPQAFLYLTSEVYQLLDKVYTETIEGTYISKGGKYLVQDFTNQDNFSNVVERIRTEFAGSNLQDPIDSSFTKEHSIQDIRYNLLDCDSRAFIEDLKLHGRIVVGTGLEFPQKCAASVIKSKEDQIQQLSAKLTEQEGKIKTLNTNLNNAPQAANKSASDVKSLLQQSENKVKLLEETNKKVNQQLSAKQSEFDELVEKICTLLPNTKIQKSVPKEKPADEDVGVKKYFIFLPLANFVLITICICLLLLKNRTPIQPDYAIKELKDQVAQFKESNNAKERELKQLKETNQQQAETIIRLTKELNVIKTQTNTTVAPPEVSSQSHAKDEDCNVTIVTNQGLDSIKSGSEISDGEVLIIRWTPRENYSWYTYNLHQDSQKKLKEEANNGEVIVPIKYVKSRSSNKREVIITYRTSDQDNHFPANKIILKIKQ